MSGVLKGIGSVVKTAAPIAGTIFGGPAGPLIGAALGGLAGGLTRPKAEPVAPASPLDQQSFGLWQQAAQGYPIQQAGQYDPLAHVGSYMDPYRSEVEQGVQGAFERQRTLASNQADDIATRAHAFGGSRGEVLRANMLNDVNRNEAEAIANLRSQNYAQALAAAQGQQQFGLQQALAQQAALQAGAYGLTGAGAYQRGIEQARQTAQYNRPSLFGSILGGAATGYGLFRPGQPKPAIDLGAARYAAQSGF